MNIFFEIRKRIKADLESLVVSGVLPADLSFDNITVEPPKEKLYGEMSTNAAMVLAKLSNVKPIDIAEGLKKSLIAQYIKIM